MNFVGSFWAIIPPIVAIALALKTKEVYISLFIGIVAGALLVAGFNLLGATNTIFNTMISSMKNESHIGILIFLVFLGIIVALMNKAGGSRAYGRWAKKHIKNRHGSLYATLGLGSLIFVDDYFNCLTVGSVMRDVTDEFKVSRAKLAYIIDSTAAPVCIIAPISSWAAAVAGYTSGDGFTLFLQTIPFNLYAILTIVMVIFVIRYDINLKRMKENELLALEGNLTGGYDDYQTTEEVEVSDKGKVYDLVVPVAFLIFSCIIGMIYTGGFFEGVSFIESFTNCNASYGLVLGSFATLVFIFLLYIPRKVINFREYADCIPYGFKMMVPAIIILILAWSLGDIASNQLQAGLFVKNFLASVHLSTNVLPAILFIVAAFLSFATGTSWGTFGILIPIATNIFTEGDIMLVITISSILAGAVCGDHISPISDTTIMASAGAQCNHINHVETQTPYAIMVAGACFIGYVVAGFSHNVFLTFISAFISLLVILTIRKIITKSKISGK